MTRHELRQIEGSKKEHKQSANTLDEVKQLTNNSKSLPGIMVKSSSQAMLKAPDAAPMDDSFKKTDEHLSNNSKIGSSGKYDG
jgi:hypothetical protein